MNILKRICSLATAAAAFAALMSQTAFTAVSARETSYEPPQTVISAPCGDLKMTVEKLDDDFVPDLPSETDEKYIEKNILESCAGSYKTNCSYIYDMLKTSSERNFYNSLLEACTTVDNSSGNYTTTPYASYTGITYDRAVEIAWLFHYDHPEFFWMASGMTTSSLYGISFRILSDYTSGSARHAAKLAVSAAVNKYINGALKYATAYNRAKYIYEQLSSNVYYQTGDHDQTIASVFLDGYTVCAGYMLAYTLLCNAVGVDTVSLVGYTHGWNAVCLSGNWYLVDVTNDYFLLSDSEMHKIDLSSGMSYKITTTKNDVTTTITAYMHDIDMGDFPYYGKSFPSCPKSYNGTDGKNLVTSDPSDNVPLMGDADGNGKVNIFDAVAIAKYSVNKKKLNAEQFKAADMDQNGIVNIFDAVIVAKSTVS